MMACAASAAIRSSAEVTADAQSEPGVAASQPEFSPNPALHMARSGFASPSARPPHAGPPRSALDLDPPRVETGPGQRNPGSLHVVTPTFEPQWRPSTSVRPAIELSTATLRMPKPAFQLWIPTSSMCRATTAGFFGGSARTSVAFLAGGVAASDTGWGAPRGVRAWQGAGRTSGGTCQAPVKRSFSARGRVRLIQQPSKLHETGSGIGKRKDRIFRDAFAG